MFFLFHQFVGELFEGLDSRGFHGGADAYHRFDDGDVLHLLKFLSDALGGHGSPGAILDDGHSAILEVLCLEVSEEVAHDGHHASIVGGCGKHHVAVTEGVLDVLCQVGADEVGDADFLVGFPKSNKR